MPCDCIDKYAPVFDSFAQLKKCTPPEIAAACVSIGANKLTTMKAAKTVAKARFIIFIVIHPR